MPELEVWEPSLQMAVFATCGGLCEEQMVAALQQEVLRWGNPKLVLAVPQQSRSPFSAQDLPLPVGRLKLQRRVLV